MSKFKFILGAGIVATMMSATAANAVITTFAQFSAGNAARNVRWVNSGTTKTSTANNTSSGTGGWFYSTSSATANAPGISAVNFEFLQPALASLGIISANFFMDVTVAPPAPATTVGAFKIQNVATGSFSFTSTSAYTVGATTYAAGSNLLTGTFSNSTIFGTSTSGSFSGTTVTYTSDFLSFGATNDRDFAMSLTSITPVIFASTGKALRSFRAVAGGSFSSEPAPIINAVPEPQVWGLLVVGFGMVGVQVRRRARQTVVAA